MHSDSRSRVLPKPVLSALYSLFTSHCGLHVVGAGVPTPNCYLSYTLSNKEVHYDGTSPEGPRSQHLRMFFSLIPKMECYGFCGATLTLDLAITWSTNPISLVPTLS